MQDFEREIIKAIGAVTPEAQKKTCGVCGTVKPVSEFSRHPRSKDGYNAACKACRGTGQGAVRPPMKAPAPINGPKFILPEAAEIRASDCAADYGTAVEGFKAISEIVRAISGAEVPPDICCVAQIATKLARERCGYRCDNLVDLHGYADTLHAIRQNS